MHTINWYIKKFEDLSPHELYNILQLRTEVFVVEQQCVFQDMDGKDEYCQHLMGWENGKLLAYTRLVPAGVAYTLPSIGRVVTAPAARGRGIGRLLMQKSINEIYTLYGKSPIRIGAQLYLLKFYTELGFKQTSEVYLEDGIDHIEMVLD
jgi:ElaA protein